MPKLSPARANWPLFEGLELLSRGKVRDTYVLPGGLLLSSATDGISIFDFVLNALVLEKGIILNCLNHFWLKHLEECYGISTHLVAAGADIDQFLPVHLREYPDLQSRAMVVRRLDMASAEFVVRSVLTGSSLKPYNKTGKVYGHQLPAGLQDGDALPYLLDTPTTKSDEGHDMPLDPVETRRLWPEQTNTLFKVFQIGHDYAMQRGIKLADTKFEFGKDGTLADEVLTPDSSRFWEYSAWLESRKPSQGRKPPQAFDKQFVREWGIEAGIKGLDPENISDLAKVHAIEVPEKVIRATTAIYRYIFWRLTCKTSEDYRHDVLGIEVDRQPKIIEVICGSESDLPVLDRALEMILPLPTDTKIKIHVMSCHRNPAQVENYARRLCPKNCSAIVCIGGKAFALPGVVDALIHDNKLDVPVVGVALGKPGSKELLAAQLSIEELPGAPVIMDELTGSCYCGEEGIVSALNRIIYGELPPPKIRKEKQAKMAIRAY